MESIDVVGYILLGMMILVIIQIIAYVVEHWDERIK